MIYYDIQCYGGGQHVCRLVPLLLDGGNQVTVHVDGSLEEARSWPLPESARLRLAGTPPLSWGGVSIVRQMRAAMAAALRVPGWDWFVNLSGHCLPLQPQAAIRSRLGQSHAAGIRAHCFGFRPQNRSPEYFTAGEEGAVRRVTARYGRVQFDLDADLAALMEEGEFSPARSVTQRGAVRFVEAGKGAFRLERYTTADAEALRRAWDARAPWFGRQWVILHRSLVETLSTSPVVDEVMAEIGERFVPDESFFQELLLNGRLVPRKQVSKDSLRYKQAGPETLRRTDLEAAGREGALFARKVADDEAGRIYGDLAEAFAP